MLNRTQNQKKHLSAELFKFFLKIWSGCHLQKLELRLTKDTSILETARWPPCGLLHYSILQSTSTGKIGEKIRKYKQKVETISYFFISQLPGFSAPEEPQVNWALDAQAAASHTDIRSMVLSLWDKQYLSTVGGFPLDQTAGSTTQFNMINDCNQWINNFNFQNKVRQSFFPSSKPWGLRCTMTQSH